MLAGSYILRSAAAACLIRALLMRFSHARCTPSERLATNLVSSGHPNILRHSGLRTCIRTFALGCFVDAEWHRVAKVPLAKDRFCAKRAIRHIARNERVFRGPAGGKVSPPTWDPAIQQHSRESGLVSRGHTNPRRVLRSYGQRVCEFAQIFHYPSEFRDA